MTAACKHAERQQQLQRGGDSTQRDTVTPESVNQGEEQRNQDKLINNFVGKQTVMIPQTIVYL